MRKERDERDENKFNSVQDIDPSVIVREEPEAKKQGEISDVCAIEPNSSYSQIPSPPATTCASASLSPTVKTTTRASQGQYTPCPLSIKKSRLNDWLNKRSELEGREKEEVRVKEGEKRNGDQTTPAATVTSNQQSNSNVSNSSPPSDPTVFTTSTAVASLSSPSFSSPIGKTSSKISLPSFSLNKKTSPTPSLPPPPLLRRQSDSPPTRSHHHRLQLRPPPHHRHPPDDNFNLQTDTSTDNDINNEMKNDHQTPVHDSIVREEGEERKSTVAGTVESGESEESDDDREKVVETNKEGEGGGGEGEIQKQQQPPPPPPQIAPGPGAIVIDRDEGRTVVSSVTEKSAEEVSKELEKRDEQEVSAGDADPLPPSSSPSFSAPDNHQKEQTQQNLHTTSADNSGHHQNNSLMTSGHLSIATAHTTAITGQKVGTSPIMGSNGHLVSSHSISGQQISAVRVAPGYGNNEQNYTSSFINEPESDDVVVLTERKSCTGSGNLVSTSEGQPVNGNIPATSCSPAQFLLTKNGSPASEKSNQIHKLKRFLTTLHQFSLGISRPVGQKVHELVHALVNSRITIEDFHRKIPEVTGFPLRPYVVPFLRLHLPILQTELSRLYSQSQTRSQLYSLPPNSSRLIQENVQSSPLTSSNVFKPSTQVRCENYSNFVRNHESLFLQLSPTGDQNLNSTSILNPRQSISSHPSTVSSGQREQKVVQIGNNTYYRPVDGLTAQVEKLVSDPFGIFKPHQTTTSVASQPSRPPPAFRAVAPKPAEYQQQQQIASNQRNNLLLINPQFAVAFPQPSTHIYTVSQPHLVSNNQTYTGNQAANSMGIKDDGQAKEGLKRKLHSPLDSRKENEKSNTDHGKADHLRVSSGPRKPTSPPVKINYNMSGQQPSSTIHYLPNTQNNVLQNNPSTNHHQQQTRQHWSPNRITDQNGSNAKKTKPNESNDRATTNGQGKDGSRMAESNDGEEEWNSIYVMLNCILGMVDKTKKALSILESRQTGKKRFLRESGGNPQMVNGSSASSATGSLTIGNLIGAAAHAAANGSPTNGGSVVGFNGSSNNGHLNWSGSHEVQSKSSRPLLNTCSSSSVQHGMGAGATALVPSSSSLSTSSPSSVRTAQGSMTSNKVGSFAPLSSSSASYGSSSATVVSPRTQQLQQQQLSPHSQQSMIHSRSSASTSRSPLVSTSPASSTSFNMYYNNSLLTSNGQGAAAGLGHHHHSSASFDPVEYKRQTELAAEMKASELVAAERIKMERLILEAKRRAAEELVSVMNRQEDTSESCWNCGRTANETCSGCNQARYCGSFCQHKHWDIHHRSCGRSSKSPASTRSISP